MIQDHQPIPIDKFLGLYGIDDYDDSVPRNFFIEELNTITFGDELRTRDGIEFSTDTPGPVEKFVIYRRFGEAARILSLTTSTIPGIPSQIWDLTTDTMIYSCTGMMNFAFATYNNRAFISPHNNITGLPGEFVQVYNGIGQTRKAGGKAPESGFIINYGDPGHIEKGFHLFAWVYETDSGFVTGPTPEYAQEMDGTTTVSFSSIPIGPAGTAARRLIASRAIQKDAWDANPNPLAYEMFFVPNGKIPNNVDTTLANVDFYDVDLQFSADYVYDLLDELPAVLFIVPYGKRLCYGGPNYDRNSVWISNPLEPEAVHNTAGFVTFDPFETEGVKDATEFRDNLFVCKRNKTYTVRDNGYEPATWRPVTLDSAVGCNVNGIARYYDVSGSRVEFFIVTSMSGIFKFTGVYEEVPITRNIKTRVWDRLDFNHMDRMVTIIDQERMLMYVTIPNNSIEPNLSNVLVGNFENGFTPGTIKWHMWEFPFRPSCVGIDREITRRTVLKISSYNGGIYKQVEKRRNDFGNKILNYVRFALMGIAPNVITHIGALGFRIKGFGLLHIGLYGQDNYVDGMLLPDLNLTCNPGKDFHVLAHFQSEKAAVRIQMDNIDEYFYLKRIDMYANVIFLSRPLV